MTDMELTILLPHRVLVQASGVVRLVVETIDGAWGILPRRRDCVAALVPGILIYEPGGEDEVYVAVDEGVLVKTRSRVRVCVRNGAVGRDLERMRDVVEASILHLDEQERRARQALAKMESSIIRRMAGYSHEH